VARITVLIVDDSSAAREGLASILRGHSDITVVGVAVDGLDAIEQFERVQPDVVLMDAQMPRLDGAAATRRIKAMRPETRMLFLTVHAPFLQEGLDAGADAALLKDVDRAELLRVVRELASRKG